LTYVYQVAKEISPYLSNSKPKVVIDKSTVPVGTAEQVARIIKENNSQAKFFVASNPEFLREGAAVKDFLEPDRVVIGTDDPWAEKLLQEIYYFVSEQDRPILATSISSAELIKYASNSFLATKISFVNEIANLCEKVGADVKDVAEGMGLDKRIGALFLQPGPGYGGSCFPKDVTALLRIAQENETPLRVLESVNEANIAQKAKMVFKIKHALGGQLLNKKVLFLGLTFKANTDDMRESQALTIIPALVERGARVWAHDPEGVKEAQKVLPEEVNFQEDFYAVEEKLDAVVLLTDWEAYRQLDFSRLKQQMKKNPVFIDLRNIYSPQEVRRQGFQYLGVGRS
jgi:UDPglucose 6-dehydrogenase